MVMSVKEEITALEEQIANTKGPGAVLKKKELQGRIDALKNSDPLVPVEKDPPIPEPTEKKIPTSDEPVPDTRPMPDKWVKMSLPQVQAAEQAGTLCGYDPDKGLALIRT